MYFNVLRGVIEKWKRMVVAGDFNTAFNKIDMANGMVFRMDSGRKELKLLMEEKNMIDVWRERNEKGEYSRKQLLGNFMCQTRIDYFFKHKKFGMFY